MSVHTQKTMQLATQTWLRDHSEDGGAWDAMHNGEYDGNLLVAYHMNKAHAKGDVNFFIDGLYTARSDIPGMGTQKGLYCMFDLDKNVVVDDYTGRKTTTKKFEARVAKMSKKMRRRHENYSIGFLDAAGVKQTIDPVNENKRHKVDMSLHRLAAVNEPREGQNANCEAISEDNRVMFVTGVKVKAHTELLLHYGGEYDRGYKYGLPCPCVPDMANRTTLLPLVGVIDVTTD